MCYSRTRELTITNTRVVSANSRVVRERYELENTRECATFAYSDAIACCLRSLLLSASSPAPVNYRRPLLLSSTVGVLSCFRLLSASSPAFVCYRHPLLLSSTIGVVSCFLPLSGSFPALVCYRRPLLPSSAIGVLSCSRLLSASFPTLVCYRRPLLLFRLLHTCLLREIAHFSVRSCDPHRELQSRA